MKLKIIGSLFATCCVISLASCQKQLWAKSYLGKKAPTFVVEKWLTTEPKTEGKFILIDFWATWCGPCLRTIPELNEIYHKFGDKICVIGLSDESEETVRALKKPTIDYAVAIDPKKRMKSVLEVRGIPHVLLIDPSGIVRWEGFPLLPRDRLTPQVVERIVKKYSAK
jgi:cytochrome c biogenesis protein CcmG, thiol:disulfide interchange protein DsbE